jgi:hypothetical protein
MPDRKFEVGQEVVIHDRDESRFGGPTRGVVTKIGRTLVTIKGQYGRETKYGMEDQTIRDNYGMTVPVLEAFLSWLQDSPIWRADDPAKPKRRGRATGRAGVPK